MHSLELMGNYIEKQTDCVFCTCSGFRQDLLVKFLISFRFPKEENPEQHGFYHEYLKKHNFLFQNAVTDSDFEEGVLKLLNSFSILPNTNSGTTEKLP